jgi:transposase-like protein
MGGDVDSEIQCPYCGEYVTIFVDPGGGSQQRYEEDCPVCCRTWIVAAREEEPGGFAVAIERLDDALP